MPGRDGPMTGHLAVRRARNLQGRRDAPDVPRMASEGLADQLRRRGLLPKLAGRVACKPRFTRFEHFQF